jgi:hypothetical protein
LDIISILLAEGSGIKPETVQFHPEHATVLDRQLASVRRKPWSCRCRYRIVMGSSMSRAAIVPTAGFRWEASGSGLPGSAFHVLHTLSIPMG